METNTPVSYADLLAAFEWVSAAAPMENSAYLCRTTGKTFFASVLMDLEDELPEDIEDSALYLALPHKSDFNLGKNLAISFADEYFADSHDVICGFFSHRGAYGRFKELLERKGILDAWYKYEAQEVKKELLEWCRENGIAVQG